MHSTVLRVVVGALAIFAVASGVAYATGAVTSSNDVIQACQVTTSGTLRLVSAPADCRPNETPISWNAQGPQGPPGPSDAPPAPHTQIVGQATVDGLNNGQPFAIRGFSWGATASVDTSGGSGGGAGKAIVEDLTIVHGVDASSPAFVNAAATGDTTGRRVDLYRPGTTNAYARYTLSDVLVTRVLHAGDEETIALNAADVDETSVAGAQQPTLPSELGTVSFDGIPGTFGVATSRFQVENTGASGGGSGGGAGKAIFAPVKVELRTARSRLSSPRRSSPVGTYAGWSSRCRMRPTCSPTCSSRRCTTRRPAPPWGPSRRRRSSSYLRGRDGLRPSVDATCDAPVGGTARLLRRAGLPGGCTCPATGTCRGRARRGA